MRGGAFLHPPLSPLEGDFCAQTFAAEFFNYPDSPAVASFQEATRFVRCFRCARPGAAGAKNGFEKVQKKIDAVTYEISLLAAMAKNILARIYRI